MLSGWLEALKRIVSGLIVYVFYLCSAVLMCYLVFVLCSTRYYPLQSCSILASSHSFTTHTMLKFHLRHPSAVNLFLTELFGEIQHIYFTLCSTTIECEWKSSLAKKTRYKLNFPLMLFISLSRFPTFSFRESCINSLTSLTLFLWTIHAHSHKYLYQLSSTCEQTRMAKKHLWKKII